jgi:Uncharacterized protein conserved in bacteria (DUF2252)
MASGVTTTYASSRTGKGSADVETLLVPGATRYSRICGATLARAHARRGDRIAIEKDYIALAAAVDSGRPSAQTGV